jgi:two-component system LytT family response regulator
VLRALIVDDERLARQAMRRLLSARPEVEIVGEAESLAQAVEAIRSTGPEVVFLDIALGDGDGFELIAALERPPIVVFVTAYAEYAVEAFGVDAVDYLLKPVEPERLAEALVRVERKLARPAEPRATRPSVIALKTPKRTVMAEPHEIAALRADGDFTRVLLADRPEVMIWRTLAHFEAVLPSPPFFRLGRSLIVNRDRLRKVEAPTRETATITLQGIAEALVLGRTAAQRLRELLADGR